MLPLLQSTEIQCGEPQVEKDENPQTVEASTLLPHEVFGALHSMGETKAGGHGLLGLQKMVTCAPRNLFKSKCST